MFIFFIENIYKNTKKYEKYEKRIFLLFSL